MARRARDIGAPRARQSKERLLLSHLRQAGEASKKELAAAAGLPAQTTADIVSLLEADGLIYRRGKRLGQVGQPSIVYAIAPNGVFGLGLHVTGQRQELALVDFDGRISKRLVVEGKLPKFDDVMALVARGLDEFPDADCPRQRFSGIGVSLSHDLWYRPQRHALPQEVLADWDAHSLSKEMAARFGLPVFVENDTRVAAVAEYLLGVGQDFRNFLLVSIGPHISGALVLGGNLETGSHGNAASLGAIPVGPSRLAHSREAGTAPSAGEFLGDRASLSGLLRHLQLHGFTIRAVSDLPDAIEQARSIVQDWLEDCVAALVEGLTACFAVIDVEAVIIESLLPSYLVLEIVEKLEKRLQRAEQFGLAVPIIRLSQLGLDGPLIGSAVLPIYEHFWSQNGASEEPERLRQQRPRRTRKS
jgi:predicted NBD/HSP70 family sugar kinase